MTQLGNAAWIVGTFAHDVTKEQAVLTQQHFIRWIRRDMGQDVEYAAVWELTKKGRLHLNLLLAPWSYIPQAKLARKWETYGGGPILWVERVDQAITTELTKSYAKLANYMAKFDQMVLTGRGICYSKGWPKLPEVNRYHRKGHILWFYRPDGDIDTDELEQDIKFGFWQETLPGEYAILAQDDCDCFELAPPTPLMQTATAVI